MEPSFNRSCVNAIYGIWRPRGARTVTSYIRFSRRVRRIRPEKEIFRDIAAADVRSEVNLHL